MAKPFDILIDLREVDATGDLEAQEIIDGIIFVQNALAERTGHFVRVRVTTWHG